MKNIRKLFQLSLVSIILVFIQIPIAIARGGGGGHTLGGLLAFTSPNQSDINNLISAANTREGGISTKELGSGYELTGTYQYRFSGTMFAIMVRPSYFMQSQKGKGTSGGFDYVLSGWTLFPMFKMIPLENSFIKFFMQTGVGYGSMSGMISEAGSMVTFKTGSFGGVLGLGAEFCFTDEHCMSLEGNMRYLPFERNIATDVVTGNGFAAGSLTNAVKGQEVELNNRDLGTTMSGMLATIGYVYNF